MNLTSSNNINLFGYKQLLLNLIESYKSENLPKKIIFSGNSGIGKCTLAYHLANYIFSNDEKNKYNFEDNIISNDNYSYNLIKKNSHPNFFLVSSDDDKMNIQVSKIREMINHTGPVIFDCQVDPNENCFPMIPSGKPHNQMILGPNDQEDNRITGKGKSLV